MVNLSSLSVIYMPVKFVIPLHCQNYSPNSVVNPPLTHESYFVSSHALPLHLPPPLPQPTLSCTACNISSSCARPIQHSASSLWMKGRFAGWMLERFLWVVWVSFCSDVWKSGLGLWCGWRVGWSRGAMRGSRSEWCLLRMRLLRGLWGLCYLALFC